MKSSRLHLNLLRDTEKLSSSPVRLRVMLPVMALLACAGCLVWWAMLATQLLLVKTQVSSLQDDIAGKEKAHANILAQMTEAREKQAQLDQLEMYSAARNLYGGMFARLAEVMPIRVQITKIEIPEQPPQNLMPPGGKGKPVWGPTGTVERMSMRIMGRTNTLVVVKDPRLPDASPKVHSFRQDGSTTEDGSRLLLFDIEYRCQPRVFEKPQPPEPSRDEAGKGKGDKKK